MMSIRVASRHSYRLNRKLLGYLLGIPASDLGLDEHKEIKTRLCEILHPVYQKVVLPFETDFKALMETHQIANEGELYCTDMQFKFCSDGRSAKAFGDQGVNKNDLAERVERKLKDIIRRHKLSFRCLADG